MCKQPNQDMPGPHNPRAAGKAGPSLVIQDVASPAAQFRKQAVERTCERGKRRLDGSCFHIHDTAHKRSGGLRTFRAQQDLVYHLASVFGASEVSWLPTHGLEKSVRTQLHS